MLVSLLVSLKDEIAQLRARIARDERALRLLEEAAKELDEQHQDLNSDTIGPKMSSMLGQAADSRALKISKSRSGRRAPEVIALHEAGLTPNSAAALCGTTRDVLKQAWGKGKQFRPIRTEWRDRLAKAGVPKSVWRTE